MSLRKINADKIFNGFQFLEDTVVVIENDGRIKDLVSKDIAGEDLEVYNGILSPAFINCHCHLELSHMKGRIPERTGLVDFVLRIIYERNDTEEKILEAIAQAENEMFTNGIIAVGDICNTTLTLPQKQILRLHYYNFIEALGWLPSDYQKIFKRVLNVYYEFEKAFQLSTQNSIVPHAPYSVSGELWLQIQPFYQNKVVSIHNQETIFEDEFFQKASGDFIRLYDKLKIDNTHHLPTGTSSLCSYFEKLKKADSIILVHNTFITQKDIDYVRGETRDGRHEMTDVKSETSDVRGETTDVKSETSEVRFETINYKPVTFFCLCVNANLYIENTLPPVDLLRSNKCNIVLGTDSLASNWSLNILDEIKTIRKNFPSIGLGEILQWATINGAKALQMQDQLGSLEVGKKPGIILINENDLTVKRIV